ncbi:MAG TPA: hypothetical protein VGC88_07415, partial [Terriglobales bacterium]
EAQPIAPASHFNQSGPDLFKGERPKGGNYASKESRKEGRKESSPEEKSEEVACNSLGKSQASA